MSRLSVWVILGLGVMLAWPLASARGQSRQRLSAGDIRAGMYKPMQKAKTCGRAHRATGLVRVRMTVTGSDGRVQSVKIIGKHKGKPVAYCVIRSVRWARFPRFRAARQTFIMAVKLPPVLKLPVRLSPTEVRRAFDRMRPAFQRCAKKHRAKGKTRARLKIVGRTGRVSKARLLGRFASKPVGRCLVRVMKKARFGRFTRRHMTVVWTVRLP